MQLVTAGQPFVVWGHDWQFLAALPRFEEAADYARLLGLDPEAHVAQEPLIVGELDDADDDHRDQAAKIVRSLGLTAGVWFLLVDRIAAALLGRELRGAFREWANRDRRAALPPAGDYLSRLVRSLPPAQSCVRRNAVPLDCGDDHPPSHVPPPSSVEED